MTLLESGYAEPRRSFAWTEDRVEHLTRMWVDEEMSATNIAAEFGITRSAILGKVDRLGIGGRACDIENRSKGAARREARKRMRATGMSTRAVQRAFKAQAREPEHFATSPHACALVDLTDTNCHFPIGEPGKTGFHFCGAPTSGLYCAGHHRIAYRSRG